MPTSKLGERFSGLQRVVPRGRRGWSAVLRRVRARWSSAAFAVGLVGIGYLLHDGPLASRGGDASSCVEAYAAQRWQDASERCARAVDRTGDPVAGVRAAGALLRLDQGDQALAAAQRWFGSREDATARQIAGRVYFDRDELGPAIAMLETALVEHLLRADHVEASRDEGHLSGALLHTGLLGDALDAAQGAVREADLAGPGDQYARLRGQARLKVGILLTEIGDFETARTALWEAQQELATWPADQAWVFLQIGELVHAEDDHASAAALFERALELALQAGVPAVARSARINLAYARRELGQLDAADRQLAQLDAAVREQPMVLFIAGLVEADLGHASAAARLLARAAAGAPMDDDALEIALQRGRLAERASDPAAAEQFYRAAIALVEKLREATGSLGLRPRILARRREPYRRLLALLAGQDRRVSALRVAEQLHARSWRDALVGHTGAVSVRAQLSSAQALRQRLPGGAADAPAPDELLAALAGRELLVFADAEPDLWRFHIVDGTVAQLDLVPARVRSLIERWRTAPEDRALAGELGELLIPPAAREPSPRPLYIVTGGALDALPLAALRPGGRFLIETRVIARLPGIAALGCPAPRRAAGSVLLGDSRNDLAAARIETTALAGLLGGTARVGPDATVEQLEASRDAALLHLAIHAEVDRTGARLLLADQRAVTVADIVERGIGPRVAVLAGCATAVGVDPEGWGALSAAFLAAGSRSVVATVQPVSDADALEVMWRFYAGGGARQPALALARAQRELIAAGSPGWQAFAVYGSAYADCGDSP